MGSDEVNLALAFGFVVSIICGPCFLLAKTPFKKNDKEVFSLPYSCVTSNEGEEFRAIFERINQAVASNRIRQGRVNTRDNVETPLETRMELMGLEEGDPGYRPPYNTSSIREVQDHTNVPCFSGYNNEGIERLKNGSISNGVCTYHLVGILWLTCLALIVLAVCFKIGDYLIWMALAFIAAVLFLTACVMSGIATAKAYGAKEAINAVFDSGEEED